MNRTLLDRRRPLRSDRIRAQLLESLENLLLDGTLEKITVADIAEQVGLTRSAFYFYFENKGAAVAALSERMYDQAAATASDLFTMTGPPRARFESQIRGLVDVWERNRALYGAMLDARQTNPAVRELFDAGRESFIEPLAAMIDAERAAGNAPDGPPSTALATLLLELNDHAIERLARGDALPVQERIEGLITIWLRTIYGTDQ